MADSVSEIEHIRAKNNRLWMAILRVALISSPAQTKKLLSEINNNDRAISELIGKLADDR